MDEMKKKLNEEREAMLTEAKKYPAGDKRNMYYIGCALGIGKAITLLEGQK